MALSDPLLQLGSFSVYPFGVALATVFILGVFLFWRAARREGFASDAIFDLIFISSFTALLAGRLFFVIAAGSELSLAVISRVGEGIFWAPAFLAGLGAFFAWVRRHKEWSSLKLADLAVPIMALGQGVVLLAAEATSFMSSIVVVGLGYLILAAILAGLRRKVLSGGTTFSVYLIGAGLLAILTENCRQTKTITFGFHLNYAFAAVLFVLGVTTAFRSLPRLRAFFEALRGKVAIPQIFKRVEKQLQFKLKVKRRALRLRTGAEEKENEEVASS